MFFILGWGPRQKELGHEEYRTCKNCNNHVRFGRFEVTNWITLFFIPVIPTSRKRLVLCPICSRGWEDS